jgi:RNase adapter protein RapZ
MERSCCPVCIVTGLSGAGKSTALAVFEDLHYFTVDGLPASLALDMIAMMAKPSMAHFKGIALGLDIRQENFVQEMADALDAMAVDALPMTLLFLEAEPQVIMRRYATTRRPHPLEREGMGLEAAVCTEIERLARFRQMASMVLDTSQFSIHDLRRAIQQHWSGKEAHSLRVNIVSFGFKYGVPRDADMVVDVRFLPNPYFVPDLRPFSGKDAPVADYVFADEPARNFRQKLFELLVLTLPQMEAEGRFHITLCVGCTGGRHRSVALVESLCRKLKQYAYPVRVEHRHLELG